MLPDTEPNQPARGFDPSIPIRFDRRSMNFQYGDGMFGPQPEYRTLDAIRNSLRDPNCSGPSPVYSIAMDVGMTEDREELKKRMLLFGVVMYAAGTLGEEPVRSQGHVHAISPHSGWSAPELFEVWEGRAIVYGQEKAGDDPGQCIAVEAGCGERVVMPPGWAHFVANADPNSVMIFGAWCDRQYGFDYTQVRAHHGLAWFPLIDSDGHVRWEPNPSYASSLLQPQRARSYSELGLQPGMSIYEHLHSCPQAIQWVSDPGSIANIWQHFKP